jgi:hypothetical protein
VACQLVEFLYAKEENANIILSKQDPYQNLVRSREQDTLGLFPEVVLWWMKTFGCVAEDDCPYLGTWNVPPNLLFHPRRVVRNTIFFVFSTILFRCF